MLQTQRTLLAGICNLRSLLNSSKYWVMVSTQSAGAKRPSGLAANTVGSSETLLPRKDCMNSLMRFQQSPGTTQGQYSTCEKQIHSWTDRLSRCRSSLTSNIKLWPHLHRYPPGAGAHCDSADFDQEVTVAISRATALHFVSLGVLEMTFQLHHKDVKICVCCQAGSSLKQSHAAQGNFRVVHHI